MWPFRDLASMVRTSEAGAVAEKATGEFDVLADEAPGVGIVDPTGEVAVPMNWPR